MLQKMKASNKEKTRLRDFLKEDFVKLSNEKEKIKVDISKMLIVSCC